MILADTLRRGVAGPLRDNPFARLLLTYIEGGQPIANSNQLAALAKTTKSVTAVDPIAAPYAGESVDRRLLRIMMQGVRKFPARDNDYYSVSFSRGGVAKSAVFLGCNGVGKSSVYSALEFAGMCHMPSAVLRGYDTPKSQLDYLRHLNATKSEIIVESYDGRHMIQVADPLPLAYPAFYCMEADVVTMSRGITPGYIATQLGVEGFWALLGLFDHTERQFQAYSERYSNAVQERMLIDQQLKEDITEGERIDLENRRDLLGGTLARYLRIAPLLEITPGQHDVFKAVYSYLSVQYDLLLEQLRATAGEVFQNLLQPYFKNDIARITLERGTDLRTLIIQVVAQNPLTGEEIGITTPQTYLNTFRFKLFCVAFKVALAISCSRIHHLLYPIVIDDVFDSSDFSNRELIRQFIAHLCQAYDDCMASEGRDRELQLIFFTQDDVIADSVHRGIVSHYSSRHVKYSRIFDYYEADEADCSTAVIDGGRELRVINIEDIISV